MPVLLITYSLKNKTKDYSPFFKAIQKNANGWMHYIDDTWIVNTNLEAEKYAEKLYPHMLKNDYLLVVKIYNNHQGWLPEDAWNWLNDKNLDY